MTPNHRARDIATSHRFPANHRTVFLLSIECASTMSTPQGSSAMPPAGGHGNSPKKHKNRPRKKNKGPAKPKMTKEERRTKYTKIAHDRRDRKIASARSKNLVCFRCRKKGHAAADCTTDLGDGTEAPAAGSNPMVSAGRGGGKHCYKCGSIEHGLSQCPKMKNAPRLPSGKIDFTKVDLPHATCYICNTMGHLASSCDQNEGRGIFVKGGGGCRLCGSVQHIASDCPDNDKKKKKRRVDDDDVEVDDDGAAMVDDLLEEEAGNDASRKKKAGTGKKARKGDQDDDGNGGGNDGNSIDGDDGDAAAIVKPEPPKTKKRKKKVVNF